MFKVPNTSDWVFSNKVQLLLTCHVVNLVSVTELLFLYKPFKDFQRCDHFVSAAENEQNHKGLPN